jgi:2'-5' RNA ligase
MASDHRAELQGFHGWNYVAITAVAKQAARSLVYVYDDTVQPAATDARKRARLEFGSSWRKSLVSEHQGQVLESTHPLVKLLKQPNPYQTGENFQWERIQQLRLHGSCIVWDRPNVPVAGQRKRTVERYVIPLALVTPVQPGRRDSMPYGGIYISPRQYQAFSMQSDASESLSVISQFVGGYIGMQDLSIVRYPHPYIKGDGASPTSAGSVWIDSGTSIDKTRLDFYRYGPYGKMLIEVDSDDPKKIKEMQDQINREFGPDGANIICVGRKGKDDSKNVLTQKSVEDMGFNEGHEQMADAMLALHGIGKAFVGKQDSMTYGSLAAAIKGGIALSIQPDMDLIAGSDTLSLCQEYGPNLSIEYEVPQVDDPDLEDKRLAQDAQLSAITVGEYRRRRGEPLFGNELDNYLMSAQGPISMESILNRNGAPSSPGMPPMSGVPQGQAVSGQQPIPDAPSGEFAGMNRRDMINSNKAIDDALDNVATGKWTVARARIFLEQLGLKSRTIESLLNEFPQEASDQPIEQKALRLYVDSTLLKSLDDNLAGGITATGIELVTLDDAMVSSPHDDFGGSSDQIAVWTWEQGTNVSLLHKSLPDGELKETLSTAIKTEPNRKYACVLLPLPEKASAIVRQLGGTISDSELGIGGREDEPHITALYGILGTEPEEIVKALSKCEQPMIRFGKLSAFPSGKDGQPLFIAIESEGMASINKQLKASLPHAVTHPVYTPHCTVAYVKDASERVGEPCGLTGMSAYLTHAIVSIPGMDKIMVPLRRPYVPSEVPALVANKSMVVVETPSRELVKSNHQSEHQSAMIQGLTTALASVASRPVEVSVQRDGSDPVMMEKMFKSFTETFTEFTKSIVQLKSEQHSPVMHFHTTNQPPEVKQGDVIVNVPQQKAAEVPLAEHKELSFKEGCRTEIVPGVQLTVHKVPT